MDSRKKDESGYMPGSEIDARVVKEQIKQRPVSKKKFFRRTMMTAFLAVVFGAVACAVFLYLEPYISQALYPPQVPVQVSFPEEGQDEITPQEMMIDDAAIRSAETEEAVSQAVSQIQMSTSQIKQEIRAELQAEMVSQAAASEETAESQEPEEADPADIAAQARKSLVTVAGIRSGYDWAGDVYESSGKTSGVIVADNGEELLILSGARQLIGAERIQVTFADGMSCDAGIKSRDTLTNMCILKVARGEIPETTLEAVEPAVLGSSLRNDLIGRDVIAVGSPMGTQGSVAFGIITNASLALGITDSNYTMMTTDIYGSTQASGVLLDTQGEVIGWISMIYNRSDMPNLISAVGISELKTLIERMSNAMPLVTIGVNATDVPQSVSEAQGIPLGA